MKRTLISAWLLIFLCLNLAQAQKDIKIDYKYYSKIPGVSKADIKLIKKADKIYFSEEEGKYKQALEHYLSVLNDTINYDPLSWRVAICYLYTENKAEAIDYILRCNETVSSLYYFYLAKAYQFDGQFEKAKENYSFYADHVLKDDVKIFYQTLGTKAKDHPIDTVIKDLTEACELALNNTNDSVNIEFENIKIINTKDDEIYPVFLPESQTLIFSSNKSTNPKSDIHNFKIFEANYDSSLNMVSFPKISSRYPIDEYDNMVAMPVYELAKAQLYQSMASENGDIMKAIKKGKKVKGEALAKINSKGKEGIACYIGDDELVFSSNSHSKNGHSDLYISTSGFNGKWSKPQALSGDINTEAQEEVVCFYNGDLYFSSNRKGSFGGYDIFKVAYLGENTWGKIINLGYPINTADNDMGYFPVDSVTGFYFGVRPDGLGGTDIYKVRHKESLVMDTTLIDTVIVDSVILDIMNPDTLVINNDSLGLDSTYYSVDSIPIVNDSLILNDEFLTDSLNIETIEEVSDTINALSGQAIENEEQTVESDSISVNE